MGQIHNEIRYAPALQRAIAQLLGLEHGEGVERLSETLTPVLDIWRDAEHWGLLGGGMWGMIQVAPAVAGEFSFLQLRNPPGSEALCRIEWYANRDNQLNMGMSQNVLTEAGSNSVHDLDGPDFRAPPLLFGFGSQAANPIVNQFHFVPAGLGDPQPLPPLVLRPGANLRLTSTAVNTRLEAVLWGRWRPLLPQEARVRS